jgi:hypothetical protein
MQINKNWSIIIIIIITIIISNYYVDNILIVRTDCVKDLGNTLDSN